MSLHVWKVFSSLPIGNISFRNITWLIQISWMENQINQSQMFLPGYKIMHRKKTLGARLKDHGLWLTVINAMTIIITTYMNCILNDVTLEICLIVLQSPKINPVLQFNRSATVRFGACVHKVMESSRLTLIFNKSF